MKNNQRGCCEDAEYKEPKDNVQNQDAECCGSDEKENIVQITEEDAGCGCGAEHPDESLLNNPDKPKFIADDDFLNEFENYAHSLGIEGVGYTQLTPELLIQNKFIQYPNTIVLTMEMDKELIETSPGKESQRLNDLAYDKLGKITYKLSDYLREKGYATEVAHPYEGIVNFSPLAQKAGLGFIGKNGLLITPESGPRQKISAIFVSIANLPTKEYDEHSWILNYCAICGKCIKACPEKALIEKETCCGGKEIEFIQERCIGCSQGCTYCIEGCPFDEKGYVHVKNKFDKLKAKLNEKQNKKFKIELWDNWVKTNSSLFTSLVDGATIAISMAQNKERILLLEKENGNLKVSIKDIKELEGPVADLMFIMDEKEIAELLNIDNSVKFIDLLSSGKIEVYGLISQLQLVDKGYMPFLSRLGLGLGGGCCS